MAALNYWLWLTTRKGVGQRGVLRVLEYFGTPERVYFAQQEDLEMIPGLAPQAIRGLLDKNMEESEAILGRCDRLGVQIMTIQDADYPERLRQLSDPPAVLYILGRRIRFDEEAAIGVVGSRKPSVYGQQVAPRLGLELARCGALLVSGIAQGIDSLALRGALKGGGSVVSVLAGGVDVPYPPQNRYLHEDVAAAGALISEYPPGTENVGSHFPQRNRILSGLCLGVLAVECRPFGGTMSSAQCALDQDRDLFAVPGALDAPMSEGTNLLIQRGAKLVTCGRDILEEYWDRFPEKLKGSAPLTPEAARERLEDLDRRREEPPAAVPEAGPAEAPAPAPARELVPRGEQKTRFTDDQIAVLAAMEDKVRSADQLVDLTQIPTKRVLSALTMLQVQGAVEEHPGKRFSALVELER